MTTIHNRGGTVLFKDDQSSLSSTLEAAVRCRAPLDDAQLEGASLRGCVLRGAHLPGANLVDADLAGADLSGAVLDGADVRGANLAGAALRGTSLATADLRYVTLRGADLAGAGLFKAELRYADCRFAGFVGAELRGTGLRFIRYVGADWTETILDPESVPNQLGADDFEAAGNGLLRGYRTRSSIYQDTHLRYADGESYTAPLFSTGTGCGNGLSVCKRPEVVPGSDEIISVVFRREDLHGAGRHYRVRRFTVEGCVPGRADAPLMTK